MIGEGKNDKGMATINRNGRDELIMLADRGAHPSPPTKPMFSDAAPCMEHRRLLYTTITARQLHTQKHTVSIRLLSRTFRRTPPWLLSACGPDQFVSLTGP